MALDVYFVRSPHQVLLSKLQNFTTRDLYLTGIGLICALMWVSNLVFIAYGCFFFGGVFLAVALEFLLFAHCSKIELFMLGFRYTYHVIKFFFLLNIRCFCSPCGLTVLLGATFRFLSTLKEYVLAFLFPFIYSSIVTLFSLSGHM